MAPQNSRTPRARKAAGYSRIRVAELVANLIRRGLPHGGNKPELIARLEQDDQTRATEPEAQPTASMEPPNDATSASVFANTHTDTPTAYHSAYTGKSVITDGKFQHFVQVPDESHRRWGYWNFASFEDEQRAYACGLSRPEDILVQEDRSAVSSDDIILRWMPGSKETGIKCMLIGPATYHLRTLYELRKLVGQPMSFRGQIPVYPISQDPRIKQYWAAVESLQQLKILAGDTVIDLSISTHPPRLVPGPGNAPGSSNVAKSTFKPPTRPYTSPYPLQNQRPNSSEYQNALRISDNFRLQPSQRPAVSPFAPPAGRLSLSTPRNIPRAIAPRPLDKPISQSPHDGFTLDGIEQQKEAISPLAGQFDSLDDVAAPPHSGRSVTHDSLQSLSLPLPSCYLPSPQDPSLLNAPDMFNPPEANPPTLPESLPHQSVHSTQHASLSPQAHEQTSEFDPEEFGGFEQIEKDLMALNASDPGKMNDTDAAARADDILRTEGLTPVAGTNESKESSSVPIEANTPHNFSDTPTGLSSVAEEEPAVMDWTSEAGVVEATSPSSIQSELLPGPSADFLEIPCMDCGLMGAEGHTVDCHIGNNLTMLDHRRIADAVEHFDPGPWTTHFDPYPTPPPEDPETQIHGMADVIRNEDTFKDDEELQGLPDSVMVLLWAFKSMPDVHIVTE
ncbi:hypothetical protein J1614_005159 [Plenodomus biglobosus]|nr:hypothetical protein J1614_005159 [Plenodomus biglobosus]